MINRPMIVAPIESIRSGTFPKPLHACRDSGLVFSEQNAAYYGIESSKKMVILKILLKIRYITYSVKNVFEIFIITYLNYK